ncbi:MAG: hypothetical protein IJW64_01545 [Clostridia bacterium]|nr:hypothetical protein [Clostridia bacterium]
MQNFKTVALVRQTAQGFSDGEIRGVAKISDKKGQKVIDLSLINLLPAKNGKYLLFLDCEKQEFKSLDGGSYIAPNDFSGAVCLFFDEGEELIPIAYGNFSPSAKTVKEILESEKNDYKTEEVIGEKTTVFSSQEYDDEAIATVDYYDFERKCKGDLIDERSDSFGEQVFDEPSACQEQKEEKSHFTSPKNDENGDFMQGDMPQTYYQKIKGQIETIFKENEKEQSLENMVGRSRWVKIGDGGKSFAFGVILSDGAPKYICYGIPGKFSSKPNEIKNYSSFIPKSPFNLKGDGYWVMFQEAINGESD